MLFLNKKNNYLKHQKIKPKTKVLWDSCFWLCAETKLGVGGRFEREGIHVHLQLIHTAVQHKATQHCKAIILQFKKLFWKFL